MDRVFIDDAGLCCIADSWSVHSDHTQLRALLLQALDRAAQTGQDTLASLILPAQDADPLRIWRAFQQIDTDDSFYWEQPARQIALVGAGTAFKIETHGSERFAEATSIWQNLRTQTLVASVAKQEQPRGSAFQGPILFGGFSFDPLRPTTSLWRDFPAGLLTLPRLLFSRHDGDATLTISRLVRADDELEDLVQAMSLELARLPRLVGSLSDLAITPFLESQQYSTRDVLPAESWKNLVGRTVQRIQQGTYTKVVLAREMQVLAERQAFTPTATLEALRQNYPAASVFAVQRGARTFIGATPERLLYAQGGKLHTMALAGSAPRGKTEEEDRLLGSELLHNPKNRQEHEIVIARLRTALAYLCSKVWITDTPELLRLKNIQHLQTSIGGDLLPGHGVLEALQMLHPTPAVGGTPTEAALAYIRAEEQLDRGWYAGPLGWIDLQGNGEFAVALRSALLEKKLAMLFAGCGIVADSLPDAEYAESCLKLEVILRSLSGEA
jgi:salicylate biosynthesis isochorismate synthase